MAPSGKAGPPGRPGSSAKRPLPGGRGLGESEDGLPELFSPEFYARVNKGPLEKTYEQRNRDPGNWTPLPWGLILVGVLVGLVFTVVNAYAILSVGILVAGSWYVMFFTGAVLGWRPGVINYAGGASTGASQVVIGVAYVLPVLFMLSTLGPGGFYEMDAIPSPFALVGFFAVGGLLGVLFFQVYRRLWVVDRPLQYPGAFETAGELLRMAQSRAQRIGSRLREHVFVVTVAALFTGLFVVLRDLTIFGRPGERQAFLDELFGGRLYAEGYVPAQIAFAPAYLGVFTLQPFLLAVGWFVRFKVALLLLLGGMLTFLLPFVAPSAYQGGLPLAVEFAILWSDNARLLAAATIVGAAVVALARLAGPIAAGFRELFSSRDALAARRPARFVGVLGLLVVVAALSFFLGGVPAWGVLLVVPLAVAAIALLGFAAVKVAGETSIQAVSPMIVVTLIGLLFVLGLTGGSEAALIVLALGTAAFFGTGLIMSTDLFLDTKVGHYVGNPPHRQALAQIAGLVPGIILGTFVVWWFSRGIVEGTVELEAPVAGVITEIVSLMLGLGERDLPWALLGIAFLLGASIEYATRLGTAFGIGMALPVSFTTTVLLGAGLREGYERLIVREDASEKAALLRIAAPVGVFIGAALTAALVFGGNSLIVWADSGS